MIKYKTLVGVSGLAISPTGQYLLTLRSDPKHPEIHHKWHIPGGGMEYGEQAEETLNRELKEELGIVPVLLSHTPLIKTFKYPVNTQLVIMCYPISIGEQTIKLDQVENIDFRWIDLAEIDLLDLLPGTANFVRETHKLRIHKPLMPR